MDPVEPTIMATDLAVREPDILFPIVGIGASAGGLAATAELLRHLGPKPCVGIVIVHHLDPTRESSLVGIFARATSLPVHAASNGVRVQLNHVYVVPPNAGLIIDDTTLHLTARAEQGLFLPIDRFFESLAADRTVDAIGVLLTGSGSDGAQGIAAIKAQGGTTFAQDVSAEYGSMPESAIATGCVDYVLPPEGIAHELHRIGEHVEPSLVNDDANQFARILAALRKASGVDFANYKQTTVRRRVQRRVLAHGLPSLCDYAELLERDRTEADRLSEEILIHVTSFFRDPGTFESLKTLVFPKLVEGRPHDLAIRVWVPGCSTGEEVYSLAMSLLEFLSDERVGEIPLKFFGTDVSLRAVETARAGRYPASIEHNVSTDRLQRFFNRTAGGYQIGKEVRDSCVFARHDTTRDPPFSAMDLISCRNLMIYLGALLQDRVLPLFHYALKEPGFLMLGTSETIRSFPGFVLLDAKSKIYTRSSAAPRVPFELTEPRILDAALPAAAIGPQNAGTRDVHREADRLVLKGYAPPGVVVTADLAIIQFRGKTGAFLEPTPGVASFDLLHMVREDLRLPLRRTIDEARAKNRAAHSEILTAGSGTTARSLEIEVIPFGIASTPQRFFVVLFKESPPALGSSPSQATATPTLAASQPYLESQLGQELASTRDYLQSVIEQLEGRNEELKAANEEIISSNEELRSTNEELQMAREELEATNEELRTVNDEMTVRNVEAGRLNDDLTNLLSSVDIAIVILGRDSRVRRFTPAAATLLRLVSSDVGRPFNDVRLTVHAPDLAQMIADVLLHLRVITRTVQDDEKHWYQLTVRPYLTVDNRVDGTVISIFDIDEVKQGEQHISQARLYAESIVDTVRECLVVLDQDLRVRSANRAFLQTFSLTPDALIGKYLHELGQGEWQLPALKQSLEALGEGDKFEGFRLEQPLQGAGSRAFILNARRIEGTSSILLALEDVSELRRALEALERTEAGFREMLTTAAEAILMIDSAGQIVFANQMAAQIFGYATEEMLSLPVDVLLPERLRVGHALQRAEFMLHPVARQIGVDRSLSARRKDGSEFPIEVVLGTMDKDGGRVVVGFITDVTRRRDADAKIREYQDKLQRLAFDSAVAEERERRRIAADLHDHLGQSLALAQIKLTSMRTTVSGEARASVDEAVELLTQSIEQTRTLTFELSPPVLYDLGINDALAWLVEDIEKRQGIKVELRDDGVPKPLGDATAALVFRAVRELLANVFKHAQVSSATLSLRRIGDVFKIDVDDQGIGFDPEDPTVQTSASFGLFSVREQMARLGGTVSVESSCKGTHVSLELPLTSGSAAPGSTERA